VAIRAVDRRLTYANLTIDYSADTIGYDQWQVTPDGGTLSGGIPARLVPFYSVHAIGFQANFMLPARNLSFFFKCEPEYLAYAHPQGRTVVFGGSWTWGFPKVQTPKP
jgi:hypothetical protein